MSEERFQELEEKLAFFEMTNAELGDEIFRQKKEIDTLTKAHRKLLQRIESLQDTVDQGDQEEGGPDEDLRGCQSSAEGKA